eukprot:20752-Eustigmatos_ZCMA.PRE.1
MDIPPDDDPTDGLRECAVFGPSPWCCRKAAVGDTAFVSNTSPRAPFPSSPPFGVFFSALPL